ncbi:winged helix-turn-helix domain-containing protein [Streptomyces sp. NPDC001634]|uniref:ArsR/SmtB family transcription factor n=1 Tax=Streptomyces sp. NPDC001634 TaxID=3154390 RepID=UPI00331D3C07
MGDEWRMLRVHFTAEDLLRVSFAPEPAPLMELGLAISVLRRQDTPAVLRRWQQRAREAFPGEARPLLELVPPTAKGPLFLDPLSRGLEAGLDTVLSTPAERVRAELDSRIPEWLRMTPWLRRLADRDREAWGELERALRSAYGGLLAASWASVRTAFDAEHAWRSRVLAQYGIRTALAGLGPGGRWEGTTLVFDEPDDVRLPDIRVTLSGHGVVLLPSTVWTGRPLAAVRDGAPGILIYRTAPLPLLGDRPANGRGDALGALLGRTRAAVLELLTRQRTTSDLARELGVSKSSASEHTKALREARLITTHRDGKAVWHTCTPLGLDLLITQAEADGDGSDGSIGTIGSSGSVRGARAS